MLLGTFSVSYLYHFTLESQEVPTSLSKSQHKWYPFLTDIGSPLLQPILKAAGLAKSSNWGIEGRNYSLSRKTVNTRKNFKMKLQKITAKPQHALVTTWFETMSRLFLPQQFFNFTIFKYWNCSFCVSAYLCAKRYE